MSGLYQDRRFYFILAANIFSSIGTGITMIGVPWLLVNEPGGGTLFGYITIIMTAISFLITPSVGQFIDRTSRKTILAAGEFAGFILVSLFAAAGLAGMDYQVWHFIVLYGTGTLYYTLFYPAIFAFNQEVFLPAVYKPLNGAMEIQGQLSSVLAGALAAMMIVKVDLEWLLIIDALTYLAALLLFLAVPYSGSAKQDNASVSYWFRLTQGYRYMSDKPWLFLFLLASFMPFIGVMVTNYLFPVHLGNVLKVEASVYGLQSMVYGAGAVLAGFLVPVLSSKRGNEQIITLNVLVYTFAISVIAFVQSIPVYFMLTVLLAFGNAGTRVARNSFLMDSVPNHIIGRVDSLFRAVGLAIRILLLSIFTQFAAGQNISLSFYLLSGVIILSFFAVLCSGKVLTKKGKPAFFASVEG
ncbi:MFS transporter [Bacillus sp. T33-2]|uniref:MFS transporter n=1 Tax=Bacillus sp. T33-2 TaxID=2054168 RepID=UPI000C75AB8D|nr:MFS transporter [Bacillus sp. T33-2]PLR97862.1 MFS transporter [Bacillus sp. T33-2]